MEKQKALVLLLFYLTGQLCRPIPVVASCPEECTCQQLGNTGQSLLEVDCQSRRLTDVPRGLSNLTVRLKLQGNRISQLSGRPFQNLQLLTDLYLNGNKLSIIGNESFSGLVSLRRLYLSQNLLSAFPQVCQFCPQLQRLFLDSNAIEGEAFPASYAECSHLTTVVLSGGNRWTTLSNSVFANLANSRELSSLKLANVGLRNIEPTSFNTLAPVLRSLDIGGNLLSMENLSELLQSSKFSNRFMSLSLSNSAGLSSLSSGFLPASNFPRLSHLDLSACTRLARINDRALYGAAYLTDLVLDGASKLTQLRGHEFDGLTRLRRLSMAGANLSQWHGRLPETLTQLDVSANRLITIGGLDGLENPLPSLVDQSMKFEWLKGNGNPFACDCRLRWLRLALNDALVRARIPDLSGWICAQPPSLAGSRVVNFTLPDDCDPSTAQSTASQSESSVTPSAFTLSIPFSQSESSTTDADSTLSNSFSQSESSLTTSVTLEANSTGQSSEFISTPAGQLDMSWLLPTVSSIGAISLLLLLLLLVASVIGRQRLWQCLFLQPFCLPGRKRRGASAASQVTIDSEMIEA